MVKTRVSLADAHILTREGLKSILGKRSDFQVVAEISNSEELKSSLAKNPTDVVIIDALIEGHFTANDIGYIHTHFPSIKVLMISSSHNKQEILKILDFGVNGYLLKECDEEEVISAVYAAAKNEKFFCGRVMDAILEKVTHSCPPEGNCDHCQPVSLSEREVEIIRHIAEGQTTKDIAEKLFLSFHTVGTHRKNIFKKLRVRNSSELILYALKKGIIVSPND